MKDKIREYSVEITFVILFLLMLILFSLTL